MDDKLTYWERLWRVAIGIPTLLFIIFIIGSIGGTIGMSYIEWEWYWSAPREIFLGIYDWFATMTPMGWRVFVPIYLGLNFLFAFWWECFESALDDDSIQHY